MALIAMIGCSKKDETKPSNDSQFSAKDYEGCWKPVNNQGFDILITNDSIYKFQFANNCAPMSSDYIEGVLRNDSMIVDNSFNVYWCYVENDTLTYSAYDVQADTLKFIK